MPTPHKHAEVIKAWADGQEIEYCQGGKWFESLVPTWREEREYRIKPEPAAPKWPQTTMPPEAMSALHYNDPTHTDLWKFANGVIAHECSTSALVPADKVREIEAKARAEGVKEGRRKEQELRRHEVDFGAGYNRVGYDIGYQGRAQK